MASPPRVGFVLRVHLFVASVERKPAENGCHDRQWS
jgi:hypothetical protein